MAWGYDGGFFNHELTSHNIGYDSHVAYEDVMRKFLLYQLGESVTVSCLLVLTGGFDCLNSFETLGNGLFVRGAGLFGV